MSTIRKKNTKPEKLVRSIAHRLGYRFRLYRGDLPGTPDLVFPRLGKVIDVRGCFWHSHSCRRHRRPVASRIDYWHPKLARNIERDRENVKSLRKLGWQVLIVWECELKDLDTLAARIERFLSSSRRFTSSRRRPGRKNR